MNIPLRVKVQLLVALAVVAMFVGCTMSQPAASGMPSLPVPKLDQLIFCSETDAEGKITVTINAPEYIDSVSHDFFVRCQRMIDEQPLLLHSESKWWGGNRYPREAPTDPRIVSVSYFLESIRCQLSLKIAEKQILGDLKIAASIYKSRYKSTKTISFPLKDGGFAKFGIVEIKVSELKLKTPPN